MIPILAQAAADASVSNWPFVVLIISVLFIVIAITVFRLHAFLALIMAALIAGWLTKPGTFPLEEGENHYLRTISLVSEGFGNTAAGVGIVIALAAVIGICLMDSGAADKIVRRFMSFFGEKRAGLALMFSGFFLSIPVFFDTVFFLLAPLARALGLRTGKNYLFYVLAICGGGAITHSIVPPTPGPLLVGEMLSLELGGTIIAGILAGLLPAFGALWLAKWLDGKLNIPLRDAPGATLEELKSVVDKKDEELPSFGVSVLPVVLPVFLIALASFMSMMGWTENIAYSIVAFLGNKIIALFLGALIAMGIFAREAGLTLGALSEKLKGPLETAGLIILITSAGGAFGAMIRSAGVGETIKAFAADRDLNYILLAWSVTAVVRVAQGSATVSMITGAGLMAAIIGDGSGLPYHPIYIYLAVGFGSIILSWMNDSGFWIVGKLSGFTEKETLKTWTVMLTLISVIGLIETYIFSKILPLTGGG